MLKLFTLAAFALAAQDAPKPEAAKPAPPKRVQLDEAEQLRLENLQLRYEAIVAAICGRAGIAAAACIVDPRAGFVYERTAPPQPKKEEPKK
jgi:hypothetical protein